MRKLQYLPLLIAVALVFAACGNQSSETPQNSSQGHGTGAAATLPPNGVSGPIVETMNAGGYTYVLVDSGTEKVWAAGPETTVEVGQVISFVKEMAMQDFHSPALDRDFDTVYFVTGFGEAAAPATSPALPEGHPNISQGSGHPDAAAGANVDTSGLKAADYTIEKIFAKKSELGGKSVQIRAKVVKVNTGIMGHNWLHIQDGTGQAGTNDLTVTTSGFAKVGDTVLITGVVTLDKDFGAGYAYDVIIEEAEVVVE